MIDPTPREVDAEARKILEMLPSWRPQMQRIQDSGSQYEAHDPPSWDCTCWAESHPDPCPMHGVMYAPSQTQTAPVWSAEAQGGLRAWLTDPTHAFVLSMAALLGLWAIAWGFAPQIAAFLHKFALTIGRM